MAGLALTKPDKIGRASKNQKPQLAISVEKTQSRCQRLVGKVEGIFISAEVWRWLGRVVASP